MEIDYIKLNNNYQTKTKDGMECNNNKILQNKNYFETLQKDLSSLKNKEQKINDLSNLSKELYLTSIPVILIFTAFIELLSTGRFDLFEYLILNSIVTPTSVLLNSFICGTSLDRKKKLANVSIQIKSKEKELSSLCHKISGKNDIIEFKKVDSKNTYKIKPMDHTYEQIDIKSLTKKLTR